MSNEVGKLKRVLVTGSTGAIGLPVCRYLQEKGYTVRGFARRPTPELKDCVIGDLADRQKVADAVEGMDAVIHLGAYPDDADFLSVLMEPNVRGLYHICDASRQAGVKRLILASTIQTVTGWIGEKEGPIRIEDGPSVRNHYALTKVWAEQMGRLYAEAYGMGVLGVRIGWLPRTPKGAGALARSKFGPRMYFSYDDARQFFECCLSAERPRAGEYATLFALSRSEPPLVDLGPSREWIGYEAGDTWPEGLPFGLENEA